MSDDRKRAGAGFWITVGLVAALVYVASFGPACWAMSHAESPLLPSVYAPIGWAMLRCPDQVEGAIAAYGSFGNPPGGKVYIPINIWKNRENCLMIKKRLTKFTTPSQTFRRVQRVALLDCRGTEL